MVSCVQFCLRSLGHLERCALKYSFEQFIHWGILSYFNGWFFPLEFSFPFPWTVAIYHENTYVLRVRSICRIVRRYCSPSLVTNSFLLEGQNVQNFPYPSRICRSRQPILAAFYLYIGMFGCPENIRNDNRCSSIMFAFSEVKATQDIVILFSCVRPSNTLVSLWDLSTAFWADATRALNLVKCVA